MNDAENTVTGAAIIPIESAAKAVDPMSISSRLKLLETSTSLHDGKLNALSDKIDENTKATNEIKKNTEELVDLFKAGTVVVSFFRNLGVLAKWLSSVVIALAIMWGVIYSFLHGGPPPSIK